MLISFVRGSHIELFSFHAPLAYIYVAYAEMHMDCSVSSPIATILCGIARHECRVAVAGPMNEFGGPPSQIRLIRGDKRIDPPRSVSVPLIFHILFF